jgi:hypothetical protein
VLLLLWQCSWFEVISVLSLSLTALPSQIEQAVESKGNMIYRLEDMVVVWHKFFFVICNKHNAIL